MNNIKPVVLDPSVKNLKKVIYNNQTSISAASASIIGTLAGYPFDSIKTRMQTYNYGSLRHCMKLTYQTEGLRGFYRGVGPPLITISMVKSLSFSVYSKTKQYANRFLDQNSMIGLTIGSTAAGIAAGYLSAVVSCPLELIKMQRQIEQLLVRQGTMETLISNTLPQSKKLNSAGLKSAGKMTTSTTLNSATKVTPSTIKSATSSAATKAIAKPSTIKSAAKSTMKSAAKTAAKSSTTTTSTLKSTAKAATTSQTTSAMAKSLWQSSGKAGQATTSSLQTGINIFKANGIRGLYRGFLFQGIRDATGTGVYFCAYEISKKILTPRNSESNHMTHFFAGGIAGIASWLGIFPIDLVKSKLQIDAKSKIKMYKNHLECIKHIYKVSGIKGFYQGISSSLIRAFPVHAINFVVYEHVLRLCQSIDDESEID